MDSWELVISPSRPILDEEKNLVKFLFSHFSVDVKG